MSDGGKLLLLQSGSGEFAPTDLPGLQLWLKGDAGVLTDVDGVYQWNDQSGNGRNATQATGSKKPASVSSALSGKAIVRFGGDDGLIVASVPLSTFTIFAVFKASVNGMVYEHTADANANNGSYLYTDINNTSFVRRESSPSSGKNLSANWGSDSTWRRVRQEHSGTHASHKLFIAGSEQSLTNGTSTNDPLSTTSTAALFIACRNQASVFLTGDIAELIVYSPVLSITNAALVDGPGKYLDTRWGV